MGRAVSATLKWVADGIASAEAAGGITLKTYRRPGFAGGVGVRRVSDGAVQAVGWEVELDPEPYDEDTDREGNA